LGSGSAAVPSPLGKALTELTQSPSSSFSSSLSAIVFRRCSRYLPLAKLVLAASVHDAVCAAAS
jgi:hypothetical protein